MAHFEQHKHHRHDQQQYAGHRAGKTGHQRGGVGHDLLGIHPAQHPFWRNMQVKKGHHLLQRDDFTCQLFIVLRQHGGEFAQRCRQYAEERRQANQHHDNHDGDGHRAAHAPA